MSRSSWRLSSSACLVDTSWLRRASFCFFQQLVQGLLLFQQGPCSGRGPPSGWRGGQALRRVLRPVWAAGFASSLALAGRDRPPARIRPPEAEHTVHQVFPIVVVAHSGASFSLSQGTAFFVSAFQYNGRGAGFGKAAAQKTTNYPGTALAKHARVLYKYTVKREQLFSGYSKDVRTVSVKRPPRALGAYYDSERFEKEYLYDGPARPPIIPARAPGCGCGPPTAEQVMVNPLPPGGNKGFCIRLAVHGAAGARLLDPSTCPGDQPRAFTTPFLGAGERPGAGDGRPPTPGRRGG